MEAVAAIGVGLLIGAVLGLIGAGGAIVAVPAFVYLFGFSALEATTASLAVVAVSATSALVPRLRLRQVDLRIAIGLWALGLAGTLAGTRVAAVVPETVVLIGFAAVMAGAAVAMWKKSSDSAPVGEHRRSLVMLTIVGLGIGFLTGLFGVGGGFLIVPALVLVFGFGFANAVGTSLMVIALNSVSALVFKADTWEQVSWQVPALVIVGGLVGSLVASTVNVGIAQRVLERVFAVALVVLAAWMVVETLVLGT